MRIAHLITTFIAVLAAVLIARCSAQANNSYSVRLSAGPSSDNTHHFNEDFGVPTIHQWQDVVKRESVNGSVDCCPSVMEMVQPEGGKNLLGEYVYLYRDGNYIQRFYELSCRQGVENMPCRFVDRKMYSQSRCVQKFSYSYALVSDKSETRGQINVAALPESGWMMDYIEVRSGCACEILPKTRHTQKNNRKEKKRNQHRQSQHSQQPHQQSHMQPHLQSHMQSHQQPHQLPRQQIRQQGRQNARHNSHRQLSRA